MYEIVKRDFFILLTLSYIVKKWSNYNFDVQKEEKSFNFIEVESIKRDEITNDRASAQTYHMFTENFYFQYIFQPVLICSDM